MSSSNRNHRSSTGSYAVATVYSIPWMKKKKSKPVKTTKRKVKEKKVVHSVFEQCSKITDDPYWVSIFRDCARGKFPRGFGINNGLLTFRKGTKTDRTSLSVEPVEALSMAIIFFKSKAGLMSKIDRKMMQKEEEERLLLSIDRDFQWKDIRREKVRDLLISEFVGEISTRHDFTENERRELMTTVKKGFILKHFDKANIKMKDGKITEINGLLHNPDTNEYEIDPSIMKKRPGRKVRGLGIEPFEPSPPVSFMKNWTKYLESLEKKKPKSNFQTVRSSGTETLSSSSYGDSTARQGHSGSNSSRGSRSNSRSKSTSTAITGSNNRNNVSISDTYSS